MKNHFNTIVAYSLLAVFFVLSSCKKEPDDSIVVPVTPPKSTAIYILNQGSYAGNNASVTMYNISDSTTTADYFFSQNDRSLGDVGNDMMIYGTKAYIITNVSSQLEIVDAITFESLQQISFISNDMPQQPTALTAYKGNVYVSSFDGLVTVIDTTTLTIADTIRAGQNPDGILAAYDKIWVSNSGGFNYPNFDSTLSVIDPLTRVETSKIVVGSNPYKLEADNYGDIYVITRGNYNDIKMRLKVINAQTGAIKHVFEDFEAYNFTIKGDTAYVYYFDSFGINETKFMTINVKTEEVISTNFITDGTQIETPYGIAVDPTTSDIYVCDAKSYVGNGVVYCFGSDGKLKYSINAGVNPVAVRFLIQ